MSLARRAKRRDENEPEIVKGLRQCGYQVQQQDFPDLLIRHRSSGRLFVLEVQGITRSRKRSAKQLQFLMNWNVPIVRNLDEAMASVALKSTSHETNLPPTSVTCSFVSPDGNTISAENQ